MSDHPLARTLSRPLARPLSRLRADYDPDAVAYFDHIVAMGGALSSPAYDEATTKQKFNLGFQMLKDLNLWNSIVDMGWFFGTDFTGAMVKAKAGAGTPRVLANTNFVAGDYTATGTSPGLIGDGTTKHLGVLDDINSTGLLPASCHMSFFSPISQTFTFGSAYRHMGFLAETNSASARFEIIKNSATNNDDFRTDANDSSLRCYIGFGTQSHLSGHYLGSQTSLSFRNFYRNGSGQVSGSGASARTVFSVAPLTLFKVGTSYSHRKISLYTIGRGLDADQALALNNALTTLLKEFGYL